MTMYFLLFILILICAYINWLQKSNVKLLYAKHLYNNDFFELFIGKYMIVVFAFIAVASLRGVSVGLDNYMYYNYYNGLQNGVKNNFAKYSFEYGYRILNLVLAGYRLPYPFLQLVIATIAVSCFYIFINKYSKTKWLSWLLFLALGVYAQALNLNRQIIAVALVLLGIIALNEKKYWRFVLWVVLALCFHKTVIIPVAVYLLFHFVKLSNKLIIFCVLATVVLGILFKPALEVVCMFLKFGYIEKYLLSEYSEFFMRASISDVMFTVGMVVVFAIMYFVSKKILPDNQQYRKQNNFFLSLFMVVILIRVLGAMVKYPTLFNRLTPYFFFVLIILVPNYSYYFCKRYNKYSVWIFILVVLFSAVYMYFLYAVKKSCGVVPYV